jgi:hypothetical protein
MQIKEEEGVAPVQISNVSALTVIQLIRFYALPHAIVYYFLC